MGYRSQVGGCFSVDKVLRAPVKGDPPKDTYWDYDREKFTEMIGFIKLSRFYELWNTKEDSKHFGWRDGAFVLYGGDWKWYPDYEDVKAWNELWTAMQDVEGISGYFCRVGEERDDIEDHEFGDDPCYDFFEPFTALSFDGEHFLGARDTNELPNNVRSTEQGE